MVQIITSRRLQKPAAQPKKRLNVHNFDAKIRDNSPPFFCIKANKASRGSVFLERGQLIMSDYKERFGKWQKDAKEKFDEIDKQLGLKDKIEEGARAVVETAQKGAGKIKAEAEKTEAGKQAVKAAEQTIKSAEETAKKAWTASGPIRDAAEDASSMAGDVVKEAERLPVKLLISPEKKQAKYSATHTKRSAGTRTASQKRFHSVQAGRGPSIRRSAPFSRTTGWIQENPLQAATTGVSMAVGAGLGVVFTGISSHWLFNSAMPAWSVKKLGEQFNGYLKTPRRANRKRRAERS